MRVLRGTKRGKELEMRGGVGLALKNLVRFFGFQSLSHIGLLRFCAMVLAAKD